MDLRVPLGSGIETVDITAVINPPKVMKIPHHQWVEIFNLRARLQGQGKYVLNRIQACPEPFLCQDKLRRRDAPE